MPMFDIEVLDRRNGEWRLRKPDVEAADHNRAVQSYVVSAKRPRNGMAKSKSGKKFRAVEVN